MVARANEPGREAVHAVVGSRRPRSDRTQSPGAGFGRLLLLSLVAAALFAGVAGGLWRAGVPWPAPTRLASQAVPMHAALMICAFFGTVIAIERAVALKVRIAFAAPFASGLSGVALLAGRIDLAACWLGVVAALVFVGINVALVRRQDAPHTRVLLASSLAWLVGNVLFAARTGGGALVAWWFAFLVLTIAAERLDMTRLMRQRPAAQPLFAAIVAALLAGAALSAPWPLLGGTIYGAALASLAVWLAVFDIARRTVLAHGLSRYMAVCLLAGYAWLGVGGAAWVATAWGLAARDIGLHALGLGFVVGMAMGHAPVIAPAVARIKLQFGPWFYVPVALLHASLALRVAAALSSAPELHADAAALNAVALLLFMLTIAASAVVWRAKFTRAL